MQPHCDPVGGASPSRLLSCQDIACGLDLHTEGIFLPPDARRLWFYDSWVARDVNGAMIKGGRIAHAYLGAPFKESIGTSMAPGSKVGARR